MDGSTPGLPVLHCLLEFEPDRRMQNLPPHSKDWNHTMDVFSDYTGMKLKANKRNLGNSQIHEQNTLWGDENVPKLMVVISQDYKHSENH